MAGETVRLTLQRSNGLVSKKLSLARQFFQELSKYADLDSRNITRSRYADSQRLRARSAEPAPFINDGGYQFERADLDTEPGESLLLRLIRQRIDEWTR